MPRRPTNDHKAYHAHLYFDAASVDKARALAAEAGHVFKIQVGRVHERPVGPHPMWSCQLAFAASEFDQLIPWLEHHRGDLDVLVHGLSGNDLADHTQHAYWLGNEHVLDLSLFNGQPRI